MASDLVVPVVRIENVRPHSNAEKLSLCDILGYQMCIPKGVYKNGDIAVFFPADTLIPRTWAEKFNVLNFLRGENKDRVGRIRLRGEPSFGLIVNLPEGVSWNVGDNVAEYYGAKKYEPPIAFGQGNDAPYISEIDTAFQKYTDIQNGRIFVDVFQEGEEVYCSEKLHGCNERSGRINGEICAGSHTRRKKIPEGNPAHDKYWFPTTIPEVSNFLKNGFPEAKVVILYGEVFGRSVQSLDYGIQKGRGLGYRAFDILVDGKYLDYDDFVKTCMSYNIPMVPLLYKGPFNFNKIKELADGNTTIPGANHIREGTVIKPVLERTHPKIGRVVLKVISIEYELSRHKNADTTDV